LHTAGGWRQTAVGVYVYGLGAFAAFAAFVLYYIIVVRRSKYKYEKL